jgi:hypothetical protein
VTRENIIRMAREAGWSGIYTQWREPDGSPDWTPVKESLTVPVTMEQIERFAALVAATERERICKAIKEEDDYCVTKGDYMLDSNDCIAVAKSKWVRPDYSAGAIRARGEQ